MQKELKSLWDTCVTFHGHGCGGLAVGFRAVLYAWELFGSGRAAEDEEIVCVAETDACGVDPFPFTAVRTESPSALFCAPRRIRPRTNAWHGSWMGIFTRCST